MPVQWSINGMIWGDICGIRWFHFNLSKLFDRIDCFAAVAACLRFFNSNFNWRRQYNIIAHSDSWLTNLILTEMPWGHNNTRIIRLSIEHCDSFTKTKQLECQWFVITMAIIVIGHCYTSISCAPFSNPINHGSGHDYLWLTKPLDPHHNWVLKGISLMAFKWHVFNDGISVHYMTMANSKCSCFVLNFSSALAKLNERSAHNFEKKKQARMNIKTIFSKCVFTQKCRRWKCETVFFVVKKIN